VYRIAKPMSQYGLDLMCILPDEVLKVLNIPLDAVVELQLAGRAGAAEVDVRVAARCFDHFLEQHSIHGGRVGGDVGGAPRARRHHASRRRS